MLKNDKIKTYQTIDELFEEIDRYKPSLYEELIYYPFKRIKSKFFDFKQGMKSIIYWFPVIWKHRPWDHIYMVRLMEHQFKWMEQDQLKWHGKDSIEAKELRRLAMACRGIEKLDSEHEPNTHEKQQIRMTYICKTMSRKWFKWWT